MPAEHPLCFIVAIFGQGASFIFDINREIFVFS
jgi:hypothetical protein